MSQRLRGSERHLKVSDDARPRTQSQTDSLHEEFADILADSRFQFDPDAWVALLAEQRQRIASAAGVDPSKVKFRFGH